MITNAESDAETSSTGTIKGALVEQSSSSSFSGEVSNFRKQGPIIAIAFYF